VQVDYSGGPTEGTAFEVGNPQRFGQDFVDRVANPRDVVQFKRKNASTRQSLPPFPPLPANE
jgi:double-strand break repair protein MRE11